ncbi:MAG: methyltransferase domain-containing protein, partial [Mycobacteriales bacterium]
MTWTVDWSTVSAGWDERRHQVEQMKTALNKRLLDELNLEPGQRVLELGGGTGDFARQLAAAVGPTGAVVASDYATGMVDLIRATTADLPNVEARQIDAGAIDLPDG